MQNMTKPVSLPFTYLVQNIPLLLDTNTSSFLTRSVQQVPYRRQNALLGRRPNCVPTHFIFFPRHHQTTCAVDALSLNRLRCCVAWPITAGVWRRTPSMNKVSARCTPIRFLPTCQSARPQLRDDAPRNPSLPQRNASATS